MIAATARLKLINNQSTPMFEIAELAQQSGVAVVERGGEFAFCDAKEIPQGWRRFGIHMKAA